MTKLALFDVLNQCGQKNYHLWSQLTTEEQKQFHPFVLMKWMLSSGSNPIRLQRINHNFFEMGTSTQMMALATVESSPKSRNWVWKNKSASKDRQLQVEAIQYHYNLDFSTAASVVSVLTQEELDELVCTYNDYNSTRKKTSSKKASS